VNTLVFDIESVPDTELGRRLYNLGDLDDASVARVMFFKQKQARQTEFLPLPQHRIVVISAVLRTGDGIHIFSLSEEDSTEKQIVQRFYDGIERYSPEIVSWNGSGFDLPLLQYRGLLHGVRAALYWEVGDTDREFRYNNYIGRFHWRHIDLMDVLSAYQPGARSSLEQVALLLGLPGKLGMSGDRVWEYYCEGRVREIREYCETDVLNTHLIFLRFQLMRGLLDERRYQHEIDLLIGKLKESDQAHFQQFLDAWPDATHAG
jgi:predicted PolB exonuclease-like 3'-5' exonuclease